MVSLIVEKVVRLSATLHAQFSSKSVNEQIFLFMNAKCKKLASCAEQTVTTPNQLRSSVRKHLDSTPRKEKSWIKLRLLAAFWKCSCPTVMLPWQQIRSYLFWFFFFSFIDCILFFLSKLWYIFFYLLAFIFNFIIIANLIST